MWQFLTQELTDSYYKWKPLRLPYASIHWGNTDSSIWKMNVNPLLVRLRGKIWPCVIGDFLRFWLPFFWHTTSVGLPTKGVTFTGNRRKGDKRVSTNISRFLRAGPVVRVQISLPSSHWFSFGACLFFFLPFVTISSYFIKSHAFIKLHVFVMSPPLNQLLSN